MNLCYGRLVLLMRRHHRRKDASKILEAEHVAYPAWKTEAAKELQRRHDIAATAIPERVWANLFMRGLNPQATADRAEIYHRSIRPAGKIWRKTKR